MTERQLDLIEVIGGAGARLSTHLDWREPADLVDDEPGLASRASTVSEAEMLVYLAEEHHHLKGRPWALGRSHADYLLSRGVDSTSRVLDFGCGAGRVGVHLIPHLKTGNYVGTDHCLGSLKAFAAYEIPLYGLDRKQPVLLWAGVETLRYVQPGFTHVLDLFVSMHMNRDQRREHFANVVRLLVEGGRMISLASGSEVAEDAREAGMTVAHKETREIPLLWPLQSKKRRDVWVEWQVGGG